MEDIVKSIVSDITKTTKSVDADIKAISRPNYQRARLVTFDIQPKNNISNENTYISNENVGQNLRVAGMGAFSNTIEKTYQNNAVSNVVNSVINNATNFTENNKSCCGSCTNVCKSNQTDIEVIVEPQKQVFAIFNMFYKSDSSILLIKSQKQNLSHILATDEILTNQLARDYKLDLNQESFFAVLCGDKDRINNALQIANKYINSTEKIIFIEKPSEFLKRTFKIGSRSIAVINEINNIGYFSKINEYFKNNPNSTIEFVEIKSGILVQGEMEELKIATSSF